MLNANLCMTIAITPSIDKNGQLSRDANCGWAP